MRKVELKGRAPRIHDLAFIVQLAAANGEDEDLFLGLTEEGFGDLGVVASGVTAHEFPVLLNTKDEVVAIEVELGDLFVCAAQCLTFGHGRGHPQDTARAGRD